VETSRRVFRGSATFAAAAVLQRAAPLLLLPLFANVLTAEEFGQIGVIVTVTAALSTLLSFGLETAIFREYARLRGDAPALQAMVNTVGGFAIVVPIVAATVVSALAAPGLARVFGLPGEALVLGSLGAAANVAATLVPLTLMRVQERLRNYLQLTSIQVAVTAGFTVLFVAVLGWGVTGWMLASALSGLLLLVRGIGILHHRWTADLDLRHLRHALRFGLPLVPHAFAHWGLAVSDRAILAAIVGGEQVGAYYVAFQLSLPVTLVAIALSQGAQPIFAEAGSSGHPHDVSGVVTSHALIVLLTGAAVALVGPPAVLLLLPTSYASAAHFLPWLALGACLFGLYLMPMNAIVMTAGRSGGVWIVTAVAAIGNISLNLALVPRIGAYAAAVNTAIGYAILLAGVIVYMQRVCDPPIQFEPRRLWVGASLIGMACLVAAWLIPSETVTGLVVRILLLAALGAALIAFGPLRSEATHALRALRPANHGIGR
jgi:O-antigen/teichoic acid export membrane protein